MLIEPRGRKASCWLLSLLIVKDRVRTEVQANRMQKNAPGNFAEACWAVDEDLRKMLVDCICSLLIFVLNL